MRALRLIRLARRQRRRRRIAAPGRRRIVLHIGAHKTGTTYIQHTLEAGRAGLPLDFELVPRRLKELHALTAMAADAHDAPAAERMAPELRATAARLAARFSRVGNLLISHEGLPGPLPGRQMLPGLYPFAQLLLPPMVAGLAEGGAEVSVVLYLREFRDWQASLYRYRFRDQPQRQYGPRRFAERTGLPGNWDGLLERLDAALPEGCLYVVSYEADRASGLLGRALYRHWGLDEAAIAALPRLAPKNVSRPETRHDRHF